MREQMKQVGVTYYTYLTQTWVMVAWYVLALLFVILMPLLSILAAESFGSAFDQNLQVSSGGWTILFTSWLVMMAKWHYFHPGARLIPGYRHPHMRLLLVLLFAGFGIYPLVIAWFGGFSGWNMMAFMIAIAAGVAWYSSERVSMVSWLPFLLYFASYTPWGEEFWASTGTGLLTLKIAILFVGWTVMLTWVCRLPEFELETPEYGQQGWELLNVSPRWWQQRQEEQAAAKQSRGTMNSKIVDYWHDRISKPVHDSRKKSSWLLRYGFDDLPTIYRVAKSVVTLACMLLFMQIFSRVYLESEASTEESSFQFLWFFLLCPVFVPGASASMKMADRRRLLKNELLFPMTRQQMIQGLFRSLTIEAAVYWIGLHLTLFMFVLVAIPSLLRPDTIGTFVFLSLMLQPMQFYIPLLLCGNLEKEGAVIGLVFSGLASFTLFLMWWSERATWGDGVFVLVATIAGVLGLWLGTRVRLNWTRLEFG